MSAASTDDGVSQSQAIMYVVKFCYIYQKFATSSKIGRSLLMSDHFVFMGIEGVLNKTPHACH